MYHVIGANGVPYGPVDETTLRTWAAEGRVAPASLSWRDGEAQWTPLSTRAELADLFPSAPPATPAPPPTTTAMVVTPGAPKEWLAALLLSIFLGYLGIDRFYLGHTGLGILKLLITILTCGILGWIWWLIDVILIATGSIRDAQGRPLVRTA